MVAAVLPDTLAAVLAYLASDAQLRAALPAHPLDPATANVGSDVQAPYPFLRVLATPAGSDGLLRYATTQELQLEAWGAELEQDQAGSSPAELRAVLYLALQRLAELAESDTELVGVTVVRVASSQPGTYLPDPQTGQPRYLAGVLVTAHPA